jgi:hypothetical protein
MADDASNLEQLIDHIAGIEDKLEADPPQTIKE